MRDAEPARTTSSTLRAALLDYFDAPGKYQLSLREPALLFASVREVLQIAAGRGPAAGAGRLRDAAMFFIRAALLYPGADHYAVLGFAPGAAVPDLKERYRLLMRLIHPDYAAAGAAWPADAAVRVNRAYEVLSSPVLRRDYDEQLAGRAAPRAPAPARRPPERALRMGSTSAWLLGLGLTAAGVLMLLPHEEPEHLVQRARAPAPAPVASLPPATPVPALTPAPALAAPRPAAVPAPAPEQAVAAAPERPVAAAPDARPVAPPAIHTPAPAPAPAPTAVAVATPRPVPTPRPATAPIPAPPPAPAAVAASRPMSAHASVPATVRVPAPAPAPTAIAAAAPLAAASPPSTASVSAAPPAAAPAASVAAVRRVVSVPFAAVPVPTLGEAQPLLTQLLQQLESGSGEQLLGLLDHEARQAPGAQALSRQYEQLVRGARPVHLSQVEFHGEPRGSVLLVTGRIRLHAGEPTIGSFGQKLLLRAEFSARDGQVRLTGLSGASE